MPQIKSLIQPRYMLLNDMGDVVAELISPDIIGVINTISILRWRGKNYIYSRWLQSGEYNFFQEAADLADVNDAALKIREGD